jgi:hypothetical protein
MANEPTSGEFRDPRGFVMTLRSSTPDGFRVLVTRKLAAGWSYAPESPEVKPMHDETTLALPPPYEEITVSPEPPPLPPPDDDPDLTE